MKNKTDHQNDKDDGYYTSYSGGKDSVVSTRVKLGDPDAPVDNFSKFYRPHVSRGMLQMYHHIHHYFSQKDIPICPIPGEYKDGELQWKRKGVKFEILDLDPQDITLDRFTQEDHMHDLRKGQMGYITHPKYIEGQYRLKIFPYGKKQDRENIGIFLMNYLRSQGIYERGNSWTDNVQITGVDAEGLLHMVVTDLAANLSSFCAYNHERVVKNIPERKSKKTDTIKELFNTFAQNEAIENTDQNNTTQ